jgi:hypothetical protein
MLRAARGTSDGAEQRGGLWGCWSGDNTQEGLPSHSREVFFHDDSTCFATTLTASLRAVRCGFWGFAGGGH